MLPRTGGTAVKLYNSIGPNPWLVRIFLAEKNVAIPLEEVDLLAGENRSAAFKKKNPTGQLPCLELDDRTVLSETIPICEYLEERHPHPSLIGTTPEERAKTRMWTRRVELQITGPAADGFRFAEGLSLFQQRIHVIPQAAGDLKAIAREGLAWLDPQIQGRPYIAGDRFTLADILLFPFLEFFRTRGQPLDPSLKNVGEWFERVAKRPSVTSTAHP
jgi:glutathione S-transferase